MKKYFITLCGVITALLILVLTDEDHNNVYGHASGAQAGYTGSPGDNKNCTSCHAGSASSQNDLITSDIPLAGYIPGNTYTITGSVSLTGIIKFGFEISAQSITGSKRGTLVVTNSAQTQLTGSGKYITQKLAGTPGTSGVKSWTFNWTAPIASSGDVTFYGAFNATNNDGGSGGDHTILSQMTVHENLITAVHDPLAEGWVKVFPNPASSWVSITPVSGASVNVVSIFDLSGKKVMESNVENSEILKVYIESLKSGVYILMIQMDEKVVSEKIVVL